MKRYVQDRNPPYKLIEIFDSVNPEPKAPMFMEDIKPFQSIATKDMPWITSRSKLRAYMAEHNLIQVGDQIDAVSRPIKRERDDSLKQELIARFNQ
jgi:hypothetical protein